MIQIPYGTSAVLMDRAEEILESGINEIKGAENQDEIVLSAMEHPIGGGPSLKYLAKGKKNAVIIVSDHTRPVPSKFILPHMLKDLRKENHEIEITLLVATGCHRKTKPEELRKKLGDEIVDHEKIVIHDCEKSPVENLGILPSGAPLLVNCLAVHTDLLLAEGFIEPHFFAGFSGGRKSILPGICARETVLGNHCSSFISSPYAVAGALDKNPIHMDMEAAAKMAGLAYIVNVVLDRDKKIAAAFAGDAIAAHRAGCEFLLPYCSAEIKKKADIVVTGNGGAPLDQNVYQTVKGISTARAAVKKGGTIIMCAACEDGIGGETFYKALAECLNPSELLEKIKKIPMEKTVQDQWQYQILAQVLQYCEICFVTNPLLEKKIINMKMKYAYSLEEALKMAGRDKPGMHVAVIPDGVSVIIKS